MEYTFSIPVSIQYQNLLCSPFEYQFSSSLSFFLCKCQCAWLVFFPLAFPPLCGLTCSSPLKYRIPVTSCSFSCLLPHACLHPGEVLLLQVSILRKRENGVHAYSPFWWEKIREHVAVWERRWISTWDWAAWFWIPTLPLNNMWPWATSLTSLCYNFCLCQLVIIIVSSS